MNKKSFKKLSTGAFLSAFVVIPECFQFDSARKPALEMIMQQSWHRVYTGEDATGAHVKALWSFDDEKGQSNS